MKHTIKLGNCTYEVVKCYQLTDEYMKAHQLFFKNRVTLRCIESETPERIGEIIDCADTWRKEAIAC